MIIHKHGLFLGKFMPLHKGHLRVIETAAKECETVTVLLCSLPTEPIDGNDRFNWLVDSTERINNLFLVHVQEILAQYPHEDPNFWGIWKDVIYRNTRQRTLPIDVVYAGEDYGQPLADTLGCTFRRVDRLDGECDISATVIRENPIGMWDYLPVPVQDGLKKKVAILGPESVGKSTLTRELSQIFGTKAYMPEFGRFYTEGRDLSRGLHAYDFNRIAEEQRLGKFERWTQARGILFCDTDVLTTAVWSEIFRGGEVEEELKGTALTESYDLTLLLAPTIPWVNDGTREHGHIREAHMFRLEEWLKKANRPYHIIRETGVERTERAIDIVTKILGYKP